MRFAEKEAVGLPLHVTMSVGGRSPPFRRVSDLFGWDKESPGRLGLTGALPK